ncbi:18187_t:CDS:2 [Funneliformis geosporum]|nr:18187_t:CDS:2 [Funneliformis geosporum]
MNTRNIENDYTIREITEIMTMGSNHCRWEGVVNSEESLFAVLLTKQFNQDNINWIYVFSMKNGLPISSRQVGQVIHDSRIQFMNVHDTEILILYSLHDYKIKYKILDPYDLSYECKGEYDIQSKIQNYMITEDSSSQCKLMLTIENQIKIVDFEILEDKIKELYDKMKDSDNPYLVIYSSFNDIKNSYKDNAEEYYCNGKKLRWELQKQNDICELQVYKIDEKQIKQRINTELQDDTCELQVHKIDEMPKINIKLNSNYSLKILSNDDIVLYNGQEIYIFSFIETTNNIVPRYYYHDIKEFLNVKSKRIPNPSIKHLNSINSIPFQN